MDVLSKCWFPCHRFILSVSTGQLCECAAKSGGSVEGRMASRKCHLGSQMFSLKALGFVLNASLGECDGHAVASSPSSRSAR